MSDLILLNANVITMDEATPRARAVSLRDGLVVEVARDGRLSIPMGGGVRRIDCEGRTVLPGFIDAHCHVASFAGSLVTLDLSDKRDVASISDLQARLGAFASSVPAGRWIRGKGYNEFHLAEGRHPSRKDLDAAIPDRPVKLTHRSGHAHVLNTVGLKAAGITAETGDPPGGIIERDLETGEPTGLLFGMAGYLHDKVPPMDDSELDKGLRLAGEKLFSYGVTSVQDASSYNGSRQWERFVDWCGRGAFKPRVTMMRGTEDFIALHGESRTADGRLKGRLASGGVKIIVERTTGTINPDQEALNALVAAIHEAGQQALIHAVEEETVEAACTAIEDALRKDPRQDHRHRIEHCSLCPPGLVERIRALEITVVSQPPFVRYSGDRYLATVPGDAQEYLYPFGALSRAGVALAGSSDCPVADPDPLVGIYAAVTRRTAGGRVLGPGEGISPPEAIRMYTIGAARAAREEGTKGSISPGKVADLVVLGGDPLAEGGARIGEIKVEMTILGGEVVWRRSGT